MTKMNLSRLGFGLSGIAGSGSFSHQQRLIKTAIDAGITHFDVAPFYGSGDAEQILGDILSGCSEKVTVTTKFGLMPAYTGKAASKLRSFVRPIFRQAGALKRIAASLINSRHKPEVLSFKSGDLMASVDESIKKIGRPLDLFLLHDMNVALSTNISLIRELEEIKRSGKAALTGISGDADVVKELAFWKPEIYSVIQLENSLTNYTELADIASAGITAITHRALQGGMDQLNYLFNNRPGFRQIWTREIGIDPSHQDQLVQMVLELALFENPGGTVLFSTTNPVRIKKASAAMHQPVLSPEQCWSMRRLFNDVYPLLTPVQYV